MTSVDDRSFVGLPTLVDIQISESESALANLGFARQLIEAALLPIEWENKKNRTVAEIFSFFYPMILEVKSSTYLLLFF